MGLYIIDNKKINLTEDEYDMYQKICKSYTTNFYKGSDLFKDLFETDDNGVIIFLRPPSKQQTSFEVFMFLMAIQQQQHIRVMYGQLDDFINQIKEKLQKIEGKND